MTLFECSEPDSAGASSDPGRPVCRQPPSAAGAPQPLLTLPHPGACTKHRRTWMHACTQTFTCSGVLVCELGTADIRKRNPRRNRFMLQNPHQVNENLVITLMCERYGPLRNSCSVWSYLPVISGEFLQMSHLTWGWIAYIGHFTHFLNHYPNCQVSPVFLSSFLSLL